MTCGALRVAALALVLACARARAETPEPPPEAPEGVDYEAEAADSLGEGDVELGVRASGRAGQSPRRSRSVRFTDGTLGGQFRDGAGDPLAGASIEEVGALGAVRVGRLAPRWGCGLVVGPSADPWSGAGLTRTGPVPGGRAGDGAWVRGDVLPVEALAGRFARRDLAGARVRAGRAGLGVLSDRTHHAETSLALEGEAFVSELAIDRRGRWRAETAFARRAAHWAIEARVRGGVEAFRSLAEPRRSGPARALVLRGVRGTGPLRVTALGALWRVRAGLPGARGALEVATRLNHHEALAVGFEEQHGARRDVTTPPAGMRQGVWGEWSGGPPGLTLTLRHEAWGDRPFARDAVRTISVARADVAGPFGTTLRITHGAYRVGRGESLYLPESDGDRLVLRALSGTGERTRVEVRLPTRRGAVRAALNLSAVASSAPRPEWTIDWTRRTKSRRRASRARHGPRARRRRSGAAPPRGG